MTSPFSVHTKVGGSMPLCDICNEWTLYPKQHKCPPVWETRIDGDGDWREFRARDADRAAEKAAEKYDQSDYTLSKGEAAVVEVRRQGDITGEFFEVYAEMLPHYYANPIPEPES